MKYEKQPWPDRVVSIFQRAVDEWQTLPDEIEPLRIVWGERDAETERREMERHGDKRCVSALLNWCGGDFELTTFPADDPASECDYAYLSVDFDPIHLPRKSERLYSVLQICRLSGALLSLFPSDEKPGEIEIMGMQMTFAPESVTARTLRDILGRLDRAAEEVWEWIKMRTGEDYWQQDSTP